MAEEDETQWLTPTVYEELTRDSLVLDADGEPYQMSRRRPIGFDLTKKEIK
ncbi:MAG: hypothetical protein JKY50_00165 [Oleispira sp.]|nr:hypothetical protein [Oleispira sp.]